MTTRHVLLIGGPAHGTAVTLLYGDRVLIHEPGDRLRYAYDCTEYVVDKKTYCIGFYGMRVLSLATFTELANAVSLKEIS